MFPLTEFYKNMYILRDILLKCLFRVAPGVYLYVHFSLRYMHGWALSAFQSSLGKFTAFCLFLRCFWNNDAKRTYLHLPQSWQADATLESSFVTRRALAASHCAVSSLLSHLCTMPLQITIIQHSLITW